MTVEPGLSSGGVELSEAKRVLLQRRLRGVAAPKQQISRRASESAPPLSAAQERLWFMEQFAPGTGAHTLPLSLRLRGELDLVALRQALNQVVARHESLRSRILTTEDGSPALEIAERLSVGLTVHQDIRPDAQRLAADQPNAQSPAADQTVEEREQRTRELVSATASRPFDVSRWPLLRAEIFRLAQDDHVLLVTTHHAVSDGWSADILVDELFTCYEAATRGAPESTPSGAKGLTPGDLPEPGALPEPAVQYGDYALWQREQLSGGVLRDARGYWRRRLDGVPPLDLPTDHPRGATQSFAGASCHFRFDRSLADAIERLARSADATLYMALLAAYQVLLSRHCGQRDGQRDFAVGSPVAGRSQPELARVIGLFVNLLPMRAELAGDPTFRELITRTRDVTLDAWTHQGLPFEQLVAELDLARDPSRPPVFQTVFALQNYSATKPRSAGRLEVTPFGFDVPATRYDLELYVSPASDGLAATFIYNRDLFAPERIQWLSGHLAHLLESAVANPDVPVSQLDMLTPAELAESDRRNQTATDLGEATCLHRLALDQAARTPDAIAVRDAHGPVTYRQLAEQSQQLCAELKAAGAQAADLVAVVMERGAAQVAATLAIQSAGAAYLPVDPDLPDERRRRLLWQGESRLALTQPWLAERLSWPPDITVLTVGDPPQAQVATEPAVTPHDDTDPDDLAYVIFTSGSTGEPKGVMIEHRAAVNTIRDINQRFHVGPDDRFVSVSALSFDLSVYDIFGALAVGGTLAMPEPEAAKEPAAWARWVGEQQITVWNSVPALMELLVEHAEAEEADLSSLRLVLLSGDWIPLHLPDRIRAQAPDAEVISLGGATEGAIWSIFHPIEQVDPDWRAIPYGRPLANQSFHILDCHGLPAPVGVTGELHIGGVGVARGYWRDPERTADSFFPHPHTGERLYRTGDLGRYRADGVIEFLGRVDTQVKIRGYRIELGEVEAHLARHPDVADCVVSAVSMDGARLLVGYLTPHRGAEPDTSELRGWLAQRLPSHMVPSRYVTMPRLPLTENGKVDRSSLPTPEKSTGPHSGSGQAAATTPAPEQRARQGADPQTDAEHAVVDVFGEVLGVTVGVNDNFFDLGGHSLAAIQAVTRLRRTHRTAGPAVGVTELFHHPTPRALARLIDRPAERQQPARRMLHQLTAPQSSGHSVVNYICVPYGGGQPLAYRQLADALPPGCSLYAVAIPGHDSSLPEESVQPIDEVAQQCVEEVLDHVSGPLVLYGHCGVGGALAVELARRLETAGRELTAVYLGGIFPFARPRGRVAGMAARLARFDRLGGARAYENRLRSMGADMAGLEPEQITFMVRGLRKDTRHAEDYFTGLLEQTRSLDQPATRLRAPVISVVGERDPATDFYQERYREWHFLTDSTALAVLDEAGHYFLKHRADELAEVLTQTHLAIPPGTAVPTETAVTSATAVTSETAVTSRTAERQHPGWRLHETSFAPPGDSVDRKAPDGPPPSFGRFTAVALSQLISFTGTALTDFALPIWIYTTTGSLGQFALFMMLAIVPGVAVAPLIGAVVDRSDRRTMMIIGNCAGA